MRPRHKVTTWTSDYEWAFTVPKCVVRWSSGKGQLESAVGILCPNVHDLELDREPRSTGIRRVIPIVAFNWSGSATTVSLLAEKNRFRNLDSP